MVTGGSGWIGGAVVARLEAEGHEVVRLLRRVGRDSDVSFRLGEEPNETCLHGADALVHAAHDFTAPSGEACREANVEGSARLLAAARRNGIRRVVFVSSLAAFDGCASAYGRGKREVEEKFLAAGGRVVRPGLCWGESPGGLFGLLARASRFPIVPVPGSFDPPLRLVHVDDVAQALWRAVVDPGGWPDEAVSLAHPRAWGLTEILRELGRQQGRSPRCLPVPPSLAIAALRLVEVIFPHGRVRADNLVSLLHPPPAIDFEPARRLGLPTRAWPAGSIAAEP